VQEMDNRPFVASGRKVSYRVMFLPVPSVLAYTGVAWIIQGGTSQSLRRWAW
jgi:hypothetical protein